MTIHDAATHIQRQTRCARSYALFVAARLWRHQKAMKRRQERREERERLAFFRARKEQLREARFLARLRAARIITDAEHEARLFHEGGWCIERLATARKEEAA